MVFVVNGFGFAILSAIFNGCYAVPFKLKRVADLKIQPIVFQLYVSLGVFLSGWCVVPFLQYNDVIARDSSAGKTMCFSLLGALGGALFVVSIAGSFYAIGLLGMTTAQGIWSGVAVVISFMWGVLAFDETPKGSILSAFGVIIIVGGILLVANCRFVAKYFQKPEKSPLFPTEIELRDSTVGVPDLQGSTEQKSDQKAPVSYTLSPAGVMWAIIVGVSASSVLVPLHYTNSAEEGLVYIPSFGIGCIMACPFPVFIFLYNNEWKLPEFHVKQALGFGILSGVFWNIGNFFSVVAIPYIGYATAFPIRQGSIIVAGLWGIYYFKEMEKSAVPFFFLGTFVMLGGATLLLLGQDVKTY